MANGGGYGLSLERQRRVHGKERLRQPCPSLEAEGPLQGEGQKCPHERCQNGCRAGESMSKRRRWNHAQAFEAKVALAVIKRENTLAKLACQFDVLPNRITQRKVQRREGFGSSSLPG